MIKSVIVNGVEALTMMYDGKLVWERSELPADYQRCDYIESTGTQWIDTQFHPNPGNTRIEFEFTEFVAHEGTRGLMGTRKFKNYVDEASFNMFQCVSSSDSFRLDMIKGYSYTPTLLERTKCVIDGVNRIIKFNDKTISGQNLNLNYGLRTEGSFKLFNFDTDGSFNFGGAIIRIHNFCMFEDGISVVDLIPCIDNSGVACMYDTVSKQPFYNQGTGEFIYELE